MKSPCVPAVRYSSVFGMAERAHMTCLVCGARLPRGWLGRVLDRQRRWGYVLRYSGRARVEKVGDMPVSAYKPEAITAWLGSGAETMAGLAAVALFELVNAGWRLESLRLLGEAMRRWGWVTPIYQYAIAHSAPEYSAGCAARPASVVYEKPLVALDLLPRASASHAVLIEENVKP